MTFYKTGNILKFTEDAVGHGCNCLKTMGAGVALAIKKEFPEMYKADLNFPSIYKNRLGLFSFTTLSNKKVGYNLYTQLNYGKGKQLDYNALESSLSKVFRHMNMLGLKTIALPKIGAGYGGGDWAMILNIIEAQAVLEKIDVSIYSLNKPTKGNK